MIASQIEFPLSVAVCAWCEPVDRASGLGELSHGICLRHYKKLKLELQGKLPHRSHQHRARSEDTEKQFELNILPLVSLGLSPATVASKP